MTSVFTTSRDIDLLTSLVMAPLTTAQLLKLSQTFAAGPFRSPRTLLDRLQRLAAGGFVRRFPLAIAPAQGGGVPHYYKVTPAGLRLIYGEEARPPSKQFFAPVAVARHHHTHCLSEFLVTTAVAAHKRGFRMHDVHPENTLVLDINGEQLIPDARFDLLGIPGRYRLLIEQDCSTETIRSAKHDDTIQRKLRLHDAHQDQTAERHRVVFVSSRSRERLANILNAAATVVRNPERTLFLGVYLPDYVNACDPIWDPLFLDHRGRRHALPPNVFRSIDSVASLALTASI
jgi:protein involved in plasmid replication-relaxation